MEDKKIVKTYDYVDESGRLLFQVVRYEPKGFRQRRPRLLQEYDGQADPDKAGEWIWNLEGVRRVLYRLPELMTASMQDWVFIVEGEKDADRLYDQGFTATTSPMGCCKWTDEYSKHFAGRLVAIIPDNDAIGKKHALQVANSLYGKAYQIRLIELPNLPEKGDVSDFFDNGGYIYQLNDLVDSTKPFEPGKIDTSKFKPLSAQELGEILGLTIKRDAENKLITFLCQLSAYTESSQFNVSFNAPSSTGKSYIPTEISRLFPPEDVIEIGYCSPTAFFHDAERYRESDLGAQNSQPDDGYVIDLSRKILIFLDQPHNLLLQHLRPILSHDKKEILIKITNRSKKDGLKTQNIKLIGYPAVIFCTAGMMIDEQESTRFILLSPETSQEKIRESVYEKLKKETDGDIYRTMRDANPERKLLTERILAIKQANIKDVKIAFPDAIEALFFERNKFLKPRHSRDIGKIISFVKAFALLNLWFRDSEADTIIADLSDIQDAFKLWDAIADSQELGLSPYVYRLYQEVILSAFKEKNSGRSDGFEEITGMLGLSRQEIMRRHHMVYGRSVADWTLRQEILPMLETAGLIIQEPDMSDKRKTLIYAVG